MDFSQALSMFQVGAITGATAIEKPTEEGSVWVVELIFSTPLPPHLSGWLEVARGGKKVFKSIQAALNDIKNIGVTSATVQFGSADSFRRNRFEYLYEWIRFCYQEGLDEEGILKAFETNPATSLQPGDEKGAKLAKIIIQHALGKSDGKELEAYLPPVEVLDVKYLKPTDEGHICQATCPDGDFSFLISLDVPLAQVKSALINHKAAMCKFALVAAHCRNPQGYTDPENPGRPPAAAFRLTRDDLNCLSAGDFKNVRMTRKEFDQRAVRNETDTTVSYDLRPFDDEQQGAAALLLGELNFRLSVNGLNTSKALLLRVNGKYESTPQLEGFSEKLRAAGLAVSIDTNPL